MTQEAVNLCCPLLMSASPGDAAAEWQQQAGLGEIRTCMQCCAASCCLMKCGEDLLTDQVASALALRDWGLRWASSGVAAEEAVHLTEQ